MGDIVIGPWGSELDTPPPLVTDEENIVDELAYQLAHETFDSLRFMGFNNLGHDEYTKDLAMIHQSIRSYMMKLQERYHPIQDFSEAFFEVDDDDCLTFNIDEIEFTPEDE